MQNLKRISIKTKAGTFALAMGAKGLYSVRFPKKTSSSFGALSRKVQQRGFLSPLLNRLRSRKLDLTGYTPLQLKVYAALGKVPAGKTVTYGELAKRAGYPGAARAVGNAMKKNRLPIVIPCHRVVKGDGSLGQYSRGVHWKKRLLEHECVFAQRATINAQRKKTLRFAR